MASQVFIAKHRSPKLLVLLGIFLFLGSIITYTSCSESEKTQETYLNHSPDVNYVGMEVCASCHNDKHSTFIHTGMGLSFDSATRKKSSAVFGSEHKVYDSKTDMYYLPYWKNEKLFIKEYRLKNADTVHQLSVQVDYVVGSGQHTNSHLFNKNGYIYQAPITFYVQEKKWDLAPGFEGGNNSRFSRILNSECISCHNSMPSLAGNSDFKFTKIGKGIDCERCHGPGELHVKERQEGNGTDDKSAIDPTIVNPRKLTWERQIDLCQRCHLQGLNLLKDGKKFTDFKPGMVLSDVFDIYLPEYNGDNSSFDMANHSQRFQMSQCFVQSNKQELSFTCITCHNPHISVKQTGQEVYNSACKNCHQTKKCTEKEEVLQRANYNCVTCHMPSNGSEDIPHVSVHDHFIRIPHSAENTQKIQELVGLYAVNNTSPKLENKIKAYLEYWEKFDKNPFYINKAEELLKGTEFSKLWLKFYYLKQDYAKAKSLNLGNEKLTSWELFMLGESYGKLGQNSMATFYLKQAFDSDNTQIVIGKQLLHYYLLEAQLIEAETISRYLLDEFPMDAEINNRTAQVYIMKGELEQGRILMSKALELSPDDANIWLTHFNYYVRTRDKNQVIYWSQKILKFKPNLLDEKLVAQIVDNMT